MSLLTIEDGRMKISIGADPELFLFNEREELLNAMDIIHGTKMEPEPTKIEGGFIQWDNIMGEYNIPPCYSAREFVKNIREVRNELLSTASERRGRLVYTQPVSTVKMSKEWAEKQGDAIQEFGCSPDFNVYTKKSGSPMKRTSLFRYAGGHIHIGVPEDTDIEELIMKMDVFLGVPSVILDRDNRRRKVYGQAGKFRPQRHGVEYRSLSNFWIFDSDLIAWVYENTVQAVREDWAGIEKELISREIDVPDIINNSRLREARSLVDILGVAMP